MEKIQKKIKENLFKAFSKGKKGNFGLGMYIVKCIVDFHKGNIEVCNEDEGVSFYIKINKTNF
ncbi:ATP-binding protein [Haloimpatiens sp. FM7330]|uniref:ATP-binding protein n=1 Tax=Haloimpatiens sp. FM7330 TaxID=3298610 RepID=UPI00363F8DB1